MAIVGIANQSDAVIQQNVIDLDRQRLAELMLISDILASTLGYADDLKVRREEILNDIVAANPQV